MQIPLSEAPNPWRARCKATVQTTEPPWCPTMKEDNKRKKKKKENNKKLMGDLRLTLQAISSPLPWLAAPTRAGGVPQGEPLCGYHTPSSGCSGVNVNSSSPQHLHGCFSALTTIWTRQTDRPANRQTFAEERTRHRWNIIRIQMKRKQWYNLIQHHYMFSH